LGLTLTSGNQIDVEITGGYASDLLSCVMAGAKPGNIWITLQTHPNVVAVASLIELAAVVITEGVSPDPETIQKAKETGIPLLTTDRGTFSIVAALAELGIQGR
jgi:predicted transcriptional regulator